MNSIPRLVSSNREPSPRRYNTGVPTAGPQPQPERPPRDQNRPSKSHSYKLEAAGILIVGGLILILTLARYWHHIAWSAR
ncbi:MAG: hypothetical protein ACRD20_02025 [Terriglobales bacterium]